ncbi:TlpA disulfide reductase family protein [Orrella daihaiensis]|uniref:TlpA family protein disulfide reductase n=1 Tax=Orrella daihaiensis TaxID=2782176 RepID=A0ABY4AJV1_9BURK|nr:TlpA disulfide reductase family protein [Orrella daihaiensis]UOD49670.1 TlpA family protein disulfide reductase [Orrella daihaiensis]
MHTINIQGLADWKQSFAGLGERLALIGNVSRKLLSGLTLGFACLSAHAIEVGDTLIIDNLKTIDGQTITRESLAGKHVIVQVWATWCPFCHRQNINLIELANKTEGMPMQIIALSIDRKPADVPPYVEKHGLNFPVAMMTPELDKAIGKRQGIPELYVVDPSGKVVQKDYGEMIDLDVWDLADYAKR